MTVPPTATTTTPDESAARLVRQIDKWLDGHRASGDAFVASVYGEWGIGKTHCLKCVHESYESRMQAALDATGPAIASLVIPVWFAPWRYEHEEHLVVPMLKTIELKLRHVEQHVTTARQAEADRSKGKDDFIKRNEELGRSLKDGAQTIGKVAQALLSAIKFKAAPLGVGLEIDPNAAIAQSQKADANAASREPGIQQSAGLLSVERESMYFDAQAQLESLTRTEDGVTLRLVVLVDDLDRCLPEKAVQVLESVKLFLNVPGFSFVLAVDDEVVERGIAHRYRDYRREVHKDDAASSDASPISGTQYLEKIVHLPVHLPRWTRDRAMDFLRGAYPQLYMPLARSEPLRDESKRTEPAPGDTAGDTPPSAQAQALGRASLAGNTAAEATLSIVLDAVPLVPRKLIRLSEGVEYLQAQFADMGQLHHWSQPHAVRVVALQQLHPLLYRHVRQSPTRYWRLFDLNRDTWGEPRFRDGEDLVALESSFKNRAAARANAKSADSAAAAAAKQEEQVQREKLDLLRRVAESTAQRGAGDPLALFKYETERPEPSALSLFHDSFNELYFQATKPKPREQAAESSALTESRVQDAEAALAALLSADDLSRRQFIEREGLIGKRLPAALADRLLDALADNDELCEALALSMPWLRDLAEVTSPEQLLALYAKARVIGRWVDALPEEVLQ